MLKLLKKIIAQELNGTSKMNTTISNFIDWLINPDSVKRETPTLEEQTKEHHKILRSRLSYITKKKLSSNFPISIKIEDLLKKYTELRRNMKITEKNLIREVE